MAHARQNAMEIMIRNANDLMIGNEDASKTEKPSITENAFTEMLRPVVLSDVRTASE